MELDFTLWAMGAVIAVGLIQWLKTFLPNVSGQTWAIVLPLTSLTSATSFCIQAGAFNTLLTDFLLIWVLAQIGYELILQSVKDFFSKKKEG